jgi:hypothetical protein
MIIRVSLYLWALIFCVTVVVIRLSSPVVKIMFNPETDGPILVDSKLVRSKPYLYGSSGSTCVSMVSNGPIAQPVLVPCSISTAARDAIQLDSGGTLHIRENQ